MSVSQRLQLLYHFLRFKANNALEKYDQVGVAWRTALVIGLYVVVTKAYRRRKTLKNDVLSFALRTMRSVVPGVDAKVKEEQRKLIAKMSKDFKDAVAGVEERRVLPAVGMTADAIIAVLEELHGRETGVIERGQFSGCVYIGDREHERLLLRAQELFFLNNNLHPDVFPGTRRLESEVIAMTASMLHGPPGTCGVVTSGGTESILMAMKAYRDSRPDVTAPEIVAPATAHAAFAKAAHYFRFTLVSVPVLADSRADPAAMARAITPRTIALVASAPSFPLGVVDPIPALARLARAHRLPLHVDACLGGFFLPFFTPQNSEVATPFDFALPEVSSMSCDTHKYGLAPKGVSTVLFRTADLRRHMYFVATDWPGGLYASPAVAGSRPGGVVAGAWAAMTRMGVDGYRRQADALMRVAREIVAECEKEEMRGMGLRVVNAPLQFPMVALASDGSWEVYKLTDAMKGWAMNVLQNPACVHLCLTSKHLEAGVGPRFVRELREAVRGIREHPERYVEKAPLYGMAATMPDRSVIREFCCGYLDSMLDA